MPGSIPPCFGANGLDRGGLRPPEGDGEGDPTLLNSSAQPWRSFEAACTGGQTSGFSKAGRSSMGREEGQAAFKEDASMSAIIFLSVSSVSSRSADTLSRFSHPGAKGRSLPIPKSWTTTQKKPPASAQVPMPVVRKWLGSMKHNMLYQSSGVRAGIPGNRRVPAHRVARASRLSGLPS